MNYKPCWGTGEKLVVNPAARGRGYILCPECGKQIKVGYTAKTRIIPPHKSLQSIAK